MVNGRKKATFVSRPHAGPEQQHQAAANGRADENRQVAAAGVQPDGARQIVLPHHVVDDELRGRRPDDARGAVDEQDDHGVPHLQRPEQKEHAPRQRRRHEERLRNLNQLPAVVAVGERAGVQREQQERQPVADDGESGERRRTKRLEHHPVADDVLDVVRRHREQVEGEIRAIGGGMERGEPARGRACLCAGASQRIHFTSNRTRSTSVWCAHAATDMEPSGRCRQSRVDADRARRDRRGTRSARGGRRSRRVCRDLRAAPDGCLSIRPPHEWFRRNSRRRDTGSVRDADTHAAVV